MFFLFSSLQQLREREKDHSKYLVLLIHFHEVVLLVCLKSNQQWDLL